MNQEKYLKLDRPYLNKKNKIGTIVSLSCLYTNNGSLIPYETVVTQNERSELMVKSRALRFDEDSLQELNDSSSDDSGFEEQEKK